VFAHGLGDYTFPVARLVFLITLLLFLPLQLGWSMAEGSCTQAGSKHVGHHDHKRCTRAVTDDGSSADSQTDAQDHDCLTCHGMCINTTTMSDSAIARLLLADEEVRAVAAPPLERRFRPPSVTCRQVG
jgi:hypothetical protein